VATAAGRRRRVGRLGRGAGKDGAEARRNGAGARASLRRQVAGGLERERARRRCRRRWRPPSCSARRGFENTVSCASSNGSRACQRKRSISALRRENVLAPLVATHAAQHVGLAALLVQVEQARIVKRRLCPLRARSASWSSSTWDCRVGRVRPLRFSHLVGSFSQRPYGPLVEESRGSCRACRCRADRKHQPYCPSGRW
jgi:hypothetical protein